MKARLEPAEGWMDPELRAKLSKDSVLGLIGNTPLLHLNSKSWDIGEVEIFAKAEWTNPGGSIKDRPALRIILDGMRSGKLSRGKTITDSSSGNTGVAYAMIGKALGYEVELVIPKNVSQERKQLVAAYGAKMIYTDPLQGSDGAIRAVWDLAAKFPDRYFYADQYNNPANPRAHYDTTAVEIIKQTDGRFTHFVAGIGTGGTLTGTGRRLKEFNQRVQVIAVEPAGPLHGLEGLKHMASSIVPGNYDAGLPDRVMPVETEEAYRVVDELLEREGLLVGYSSGAAMAAAVALAREIKRGIIVTIFPDGGERYLSEKTGSVIGNQ